MKKILLLLLLLPLSLLAQDVTVKGVVKDLSTSLPLDHVTISTADGKNATISNEEGAFALSYPNGAKTIRLSYLGYADYEVAATSLPADGIYYLEPKDFVLDEIVIINKPINELIEELVANSILHLDAPLLLNTYYREFVKVNNEYTKFADGLVDYSLSRNKKNVKTEVTVKQSRAAKLPTDETIDAASGLDVRKAVARSSVFYALDNTLFDGDNYKKHDFIIRAQKDASGKAIQVISFTPTAGINEALYTGRIVYDPETNLILNFDIKLEPANAQFAKVVNLLIIKAKLTALDYKSGFKVTDGKYMLAYASRNGALHFWNKRTYNDALEFKSDLVITGYSTSVPKIEKSDKYRDKTLYERGTSYTDKFWLKGNAVLLTKEEEAVVKSLEGAQ